MFVKWKEYDDSYRSWFDKNNVISFCFFCFFLDITKMSHLFPNLSSKVRTNIQLKQDLTSFANETYVKDPTGI